MLTRVSGGKEGIKAYLENGHKQGREFHRDQLDERVILAGDLDFTQKIIDRIEIDGERYLHITLSFKEDEISRDTLLAITENFRKFMFSAYKEDEYNFYAEAHLPKIKSYENEKTGEIVERKPHIHFVVPKINLRTGGALNPFGLVERSEKHLDAFQEHINNKYGLASPKDNRRVYFTDASDMIQRYKDDNFKGSNKELKKAILEAVLDRNVTSYDGFSKLLNEFGETRVRNAGRHNEYLNVKVVGENKGVNLKDYPFTRQFIELSGDEKKGMLTAEIRRTYDVQGEARKDPVDVSAALEEWHRFRAREIKYVNSGNKKLYRTYRAATPDEREQILVHLATKFYEKYPGPQTEPEPFTGRNPFDPAYGLKQALGEQVQLSLLDNTGIRGGLGMSPAGVHSSTIDAVELRGLEPDGAGGLSLEPRPDRQQEPMPLVAFEQARGLGNASPSIDPAQHSVKNPIDHDYAIKGETAGIDSWAHQPGQQQDIEALVAFEQTHTLSRAHTTPAVLFHQQEPYHERAKYAGKNSVGHEYGYKRPETAADWNGARVDREGAPGRHSGHAGGFSGRPEGQRSTGAAGKRGNGGSNWLAGHPDRQHDIISLRQVEKTVTLDRLRRLPGGRMVRSERESAVLLPDHALDQLGNRAGGPDHYVRRSRHLQPVRGTGRFNDSVISQIVRDFEERQGSEGAGKLPEFQEIKYKLDAKRLLAELSRSHGVIITKYRVMAAADGSARIRAGNRTLNVCDFMTKEMRLPWAEAATVLRRLYSRQVDRHPEVAPKLPPSPTLWRQFQDQRRGRGGLRTQLAAQLASERARQEGLKERLDEARSSATGLSAAERKAALSVARMEFLAATDTLRSNIRAERAPFRLSVADEYRQFLQQRAQAGDEAALTELRRRSRSASLRVDPAVGHIRAVDPHQEPNAMLYRGRQVSYRVHLDGDVVYSIAGREIIQDKDDSIVLLQTDRLAIETALRLAQEKFGKSLKLSGSAEFEERAARIAAEAGLEVRFENKRAEEIREHRSTELASQRAVGRRFIESQSRFQSGAADGIPDVKQPTREAPEKPIHVQMPDEPEIE